MRTARHAYCPPCVLTATYRWPRAGHHLPQAIYHYRSPWTGQRDDHRAALRTVITVSGPWWAAFDPDGP
ncbi:MAG: hypothetical protein M3Y35_03850, partial [Actinomycetota bacterium]|nr:hypothetical protein [Actinomycetota bacterium]